MYRSQSLPTARSYISGSEMDPDVFSYRDTRYQHLRGSSTPNDVSFIELSMRSTVVVHVVGHIPELADLILSFAHRSSLYNCLFVCKTYSCIARKYLWRLLPSATPLFNLLGPIVSIKQPDSYFDCWAFRAPPSDLQWENFRAYAKYVKTIAQPYSWSNGTTDHDLSPDLGPGKSPRDSESRQGEFRDLESRDPDSEDLDSEDLEWIQTHDDDTGCCNSSAFPISNEALALLETPEPSSPQSCSIGKLSLTPNLNQLAFAFGSSYTPPTAFLPFLGSGLVTLDLLYHVCVRVFQSRDETIRMIKHISESLRVLAAYPSDRSPLPSLRKLHICLEHEELSMFRGYEDINRVILDALDMCRELQKVKLPPFQRQDDLLARLRNLVQLSSITVSFSTHEEMISFAEGIVSTHPNLRTLRLGHHAYTPTSVDVLKPLLKLRNLVKLSIESYWAYTSEFRLDPPWFLSTTFLQDLSNAWPNLESLTLSPSNYISIRSLESFQDSNLFPRLRRLALDIDDAIQEPPTRKDVVGAVRSIRPLRSLQRLEIYTPTDTMVGTGNTFALMTYAERIGSSRMEILLNGDSPRGRYDSL
ncbi:hypothetical protein FS837_006384 [Tulasnella sp. UAMH 9824]|nr:hypothetical protein FS837_006384 [Tulasnella sp. UAMH 9824]